MMKMGECSEASALASASPSASATMAESSSAASSVASAEPTSHRSSKDPPSSRPVGEAQAVAKTSKEKAALSDATTSVDEDDQMKLGEDVEKEEEVDDEGLRVAGYDVVISGTGLVQSILASALTRAGRSVLHCDGHDSYGELDSVLSLDGLERWCQDHDDYERRPEKEDEDEDEDEGSASVVELDPRGGCAGVRIHSVGRTTTITTSSSSSLSVGTKVSTPYGNGTVVEHDDVERKWDSLAVRLDGGGGSSSMAYFGRPRPLPIPSSYNGSGCRHDADSHGATTTAEADEAVAAYHERNHNVVPLSTLEARSLLSRSRQFALDLTPGLLYATGRAVDGLVKSNVAEYLEFKSVLGLFLLMDPDDNGGNSGAGKKKRAVGRGSSKSRSRSRRGGEGPRSKAAPAAVAASEKREERGIGEGNFDGVTGDPSPHRCRRGRLEWSRVPCSRGDIFQTRLLGPVDKRRLMKFLQLSADHGFAVEASSWSSSSSTGDAAGGRDAMVEGLDNAATMAAAPSQSSSDPSLLSSSTTAREIDDDGVRSLNERQLKQGRSLSRPQNKAVQTDEMDALLRSMRENVPFDDYLRDERGLPDRLRTVVMYALALRGGTGGNDNGGGGAYTTKRAMDDLTRHLLSLGRFGTTALLAPLYGCGELSQAFCRSAAVHGGTYLLRRPALRVLLNGDGCKDGGGTNSKKSNKGVRGIFLGGDRDPNTGFGGCEQDKTVLCQHAVIPENAVGGGGRRRVLRRISILRGALVTRDGLGGSQEEEQRHILIVPPGAGGLGNGEVIHGVAVDFGVCVAPQAQCTVLHLTTTLEGDGDGDGDDVLADAVRSLVEARPQGSDPVDEIFHASFSYPDRCGAASVPSARGLHVCHRTGQSVTVESVFAEARRIFEEICPDQDFLSLSEEMDAVVRERAGDRGYNSDDEGMVLESAMNMIGPPPSQSSVDDMPA